MSNSFYNHGAFPSTGSAATSASMRAELDLISAGFDKMPTLAGNANKFVVINSTGTGMTQTDVLPAFTVTDTDFTVQDDGDNTRKFQFNAGSITTGNTRVYSMPDLNTTLVGTDVTQTLTNKTLTAPVIATIVNTGTLTLPTSTDTLIGRNTTDTLTNKTLTNPVIGTIINTGTLTLPTSTDTLVGRATTDTLTNKTISGANNSLANIGNSSLTNSSVVIGSTTLSLGGTMTSLAGVTISGSSNTLSNIANASLTNSSVTFNGVAVALGATGTITASTTNALTVSTGLQLDTGTTFNGGAARTISIDSTVVTLSGSQTLSNKTISGSSNTLSNIANSSLTNSSITIGSSAISLGSTASTITGLTSLSSTGLVMTANAASSTAISAIAQSAGTVTVTAAGHALTSGDLVSIDGVADYTYTGLVTVNVTNANVFTYSRTTTNASSSGGYVTKVQGTWASYSGGTGPSYKGGPMVISASSQMPGLRVTQAGNGYAFIVEDATNPDTSAFIIANDGSLSVNTNKFTIDAATGNTAIAGTTSFGGNIVSNLLFTDATYDIGASGATRPRNLYLGGTILTLNNTAAVSISAVSSGGGSTLNLSANTAGGFANQISFSALGTSKWALGGGNIGSGTANDFGLYDYNNAKTTYLVQSSTGNMLMNTNLLFVDNTYDIGASSATRPRNLYLSGTVFDIRNSATVSGTFKSTAGQALLTLDAATTGTSNSNVIIFASNGTNRWYLGGGNVGVGGNYDFTLLNYSASATVMNVPSGGNNVYFPGKISVFGASGANQPVTVQADTNGHSLWTINDTTLGYGQIYFGGSASSGFQGVRADGRSTGWLDLITNDTRRFRIDSAGAATFYNNVFSFDSSYPFFNNIAGGSTKTIASFNMSGTYYSALFDSGLTGGSGSKIYFSRTVTNGGAYVYALQSWDFENSRIGINTPTPTANLDVRGAGGSGTASLTVKSVTSGGAAVNLDLATTVGGASAQLAFALAGTTKYAMGYANIGGAGVNDFAVYNYTNSQNPWIITSTDYQRLPRTAAFLATVGTNYTATGPSVVKFDTTVWDNRSNFDTANYRFIAPVDGYYQFNVTVNQYNVTVGTTFEIGFRKNGGAYAGTRLVSGSTSDQNITCSMAIYMSSGDNVDVQSFTTGGFSASVRWNVFSGHLIG